MNWNKLVKFVSDYEIGEATEEQGIEAVKFLINNYDLKKLKDKELAVASDVFQGLSQILSDRLF